MKVCRKCGEPREKGKRCRPCENARCAAYHAANRVKIAARKALWRKANRSNIALRQAAWREANREAVANTKAAWWKRNRVAGLAKNAEWRAANRKRIAEHRAATKARIDARQAAWRELHPDQLAAYRQNRRARNRTALGSFTPAEWEAKKKAFGFRCIDCDKRTKLTVGHAIPLARGGSNFIGNIIPQCFSCNAKQNARVHRSVQMASFFDLPIAAATADS
jgi:5-methylcytosine-specific restriction endonuclease McrA